MADFVAVSDYVGIILVYINGNPCLPEKSPGLVRANLDLPDQHIQVIECSLTGVQGHLTLLPQLMIDGIQALVPIMFHDLGD